MTNSNRVYALKLFLLNEPGEMSAWIAAESAEEAINTYLGESGMTRGEVWGSDGPPVPEEWDETKAAKTTLSNDDDDTKLNLWELFLEATVPMVLAESEY